MNINGVEQGCIRSQNIVCLIDLLVEVESEKYDTAAQFKAAINNKINGLRGEINGLRNR